jgi:hypothetical protein
MTTPTPPKGAATTADAAGSGLKVDLWLLSLLILALSCYLAGVHFNGSYALLGVLLAVMSVGLGYLDQLSLFPLMIPLAVLAVWIFARRKGT